LTAAGKPELAEQIVNEALLEVKLEQLRTLQAEIAELRGTTGADQTVTLRVKVLELRVDKMKQFGLDLQTSDGERFDKITCQALVKLNAIDGLLEALQRQKLAKVLAEPTIVTVSGRHATFQSGGEFPIVVPQSSGTVAIEYRQFGTRLDCLPKVLDGGRIRLELCTAVSEIDESRSTTIQDRPVPGLRTRRVDTAVELEDGQTLVLSGLKQNRPTKGGGESCKTEETALVVAVTASLSGPVRQAVNTDPSKPR
jgi:Flp pilus assembly secretin CpaC